MHNIELKTPEGYFEASLARTLSGAAAIRKRRAAVLGAAAAVLLVAGVAWTSVRAQEQKAYLAEQAELAELDIFLEIN
jgi:hypothetical protein